MTETRSRRRIREAVESRGRKLVSLDYEHWYDGGEMSGTCGGWYGALDGPDALSPHRPNDVMGLSVDETIAWVDEFLDPPEPCECRRSDQGPLLSTKPTWNHRPECRWHLRYWLRWWGPRP